MFTKDDGKLGTRGYGALVTVALAIKVCDQTPTFVYKTAYNAGWMLPIVAMPVVLPSFVILLVLLKRYKNKSIMDITFSLAGKYLGFIIGMLFFISSFSFTVVATRSYIDIMSALFFVKTPMIILYLVFIVPCFFIAKRGLEAIGRTAYLTQPYVKAIIFLMIILVLKQADFGFIYPIAGAGIKPILAGGIMYSTFCQEVVLLAVFFPYVRGYKEFKLGSVIGLSIGVVEQCSMFLLYLSVLDFPPVVINNYIFQVVTRLLYSGRFLSNIEGLFLIIWIIDSVIVYAMYIYMSSAYFAYSLKLPEFKAFLLPMSALCIIIGMIPDNNYTNAIIMRDYILKVNWMFVFGMPFILLILSQIKGDYKNQNENS